MNKSSNDISVLPTTFRQVDFYVYEDTIGTHETSILCLSNAIKETTCEWKGSVFKHQKPRGKGLNYFC